MSKTQHNENLHYPLYTHCVPVDPGFVEACEVCFTIACTQLVPNIPRKVLRRVHLYWHPMENSSTHVLSPLPGHKQCVDHTHHLPPQTPLLHIHWETLLTMAGQGRRWFISVHQHEPEKKERSRHLQTKLHPPYSKQTACLAYEFWSEAVC